MSNSRITMEELVSQQLPVRRQVLGILLLSIPAIISQLGTIVMEYIDASMVGSLGADASAAIGLSASTTWLLGGMTTAAASGFSVQIAQYIGAGQRDEARRLFKQALPMVLLFSSGLLIFMALASPHIPVWLGGEPVLRHDAGMYLLIYGLSLPFVQLIGLGSAVLQCSGNIRLPSILNVSRCGLDVIYNLFLIYPARNIHIGSASFLMPGAGLGVTGAALGTALSEVTVALIIMVILCLRHPLFRLRRQDSWLIRPVSLKTAVRISVPIALERAAFSGALVVVTSIISPLGSVALAANSFAVTAEGLCYMPGYGLGSTATALVGQSIGAGKPAQARRYAFITVGLGMVLMGLSGAFMYAVCPYVFMFLTPVTAIQALAVRILRLEIIAEPFYGASIVASGALTGAGDTLMPGLMNLASIWGVRLPLSLILVGRFGLVGVWAAMCIELFFRGAIFLIRLIRGKWMKKII